MLLGMGAKTKLVNKVDHLPEIVAGLNPVLQFRKDFPDLIFDGIRSFRICFELLEIGKQLAIDKFSQIITGKSLMVV